jgi:hypothetical protein
VGRTALQGNNDGLGAVSPIQAHPYYADVGLNSGLFDGQLVRDFRVALTVDQQGQHFTLGGAEPTVQHAGGQGAGDRRTQEIASGMHLSQSFHEHFVRHPFDEVPRGAGFERLVDILVAFRRIFWATG